MKIIIFGLLMAFILSGCSTIPSTPKPHPEKYTFQVITIEIPGDLPEYHNKADKMMGLEFSKGSSLPTSLTIPSRDLEKLIQHPEAEITEYPIVLAGLGESVTNDQTKSVLMPENYDIVDGKAVVKEKIIKLGYSVAVTVDKIENEEISYHLNSNFKELKGFDEYKTENGLVVKMPYFKMRAMDSDLTHEPNSWTMLGGLIDQRSDGKKINQLFCVRAISPNAVQ
jgi:hypothetical protein